MRRFAANLTKCVVEARPAVLVIHLIRFAAGAAVVPVGAAHGGVVREAVGTFSWEAAIFAIYLFNGLSDLRGDRLNGSHRPMAAGRLSPVVANGHVLAAAVLAVAAAVWTGIAAAGPVLAVLLIGWQYSAGPLTLKRWPAGTAFVGGCLGLLAYVAGFGIRAGNAWTRPGTAAVIFVAVMSAWMAFVGAPAKDLPDVRGDRAASRRTLPIRYGEAATRRIIAADAVLIAAGLIVAAFLSAPLLRWPSLAMAVCAVAIVLACLTGAKRTDRARRRLPYEVFMIAQYAVNCMLLAVIVC